MHKMENLDNIYTNNAYLEKNSNWHEEDASWKYGHIKQIISDISFDSVVDVGCGTGKILDLFQSDFPNKEFYGYDFSENLQNFWNKRSSKIKFHPKNIHTETYYFDLLLLIDVFEHVEDYYFFLRSLRSKAKYFVFHIPLDMYVLNTLTNNYKHKKESVGHLHYFDHNTARGVLTDTGFTIMKYKFTKSYLQSNAKLSKKLAFLRKVGSFIFGDELNSRVFGGYSLMVLCKKNF